MKRARSIFAGAVIAGAIVVGSVIPAAAQTTPFSGGVYDCNWGWVGLTSNAKGHVNHKEGVATYKSWNNGSTYKINESNSGKHIVPSWSIFLTGVGGDMTYGYAVCRG